MRISTAGQHRLAFGAINDRTSELLRTQNQIASGKRIQTPADDPSGSVRALALDRALAESKQYARNADVVTSRLSLEEQTLADAGSLLDRVRVLTVQANSPTLDQASRQAIAVEVRVRLRELVDLANRRDSNGEYLFSGLSTLVQPFSQSGSAVTYVGDQGSRLVPTSPTQRVADGHSGFDVFMDIVNGNGTFTTAADADNTGTGIVGVGSVSSPADWVPDTYTLHFIDATNWEVLDGTNSQVTTGTFTTPGTIAFNGIQVTISGSPAADDIFTIAPSSKQDVFTTVSNLLDGLNSSTTTTAEQAQFATDMGSALQHIDRALAHLSNVRSDVGARLQVLDQSEETRLDTEVELQRSISELRDLDFAEAVTKLNLQLVGLQAAQSSYARLTQISLFDYIR
jgi:flagellar hook-associated protein 3 FlgL